MFVKNYFLGMAKSVSVVVALTTGVATVSAVLSPAVMAAEKGQKLSSKMKPLGEAQKLMSEKKWKEALSVINEQVVPISGKTAYEEQVTNELKAFCLAQLRDYVGAAKIYETMLANNQVPADQVAAKVLVVSQAAFQQKDYAKSIQFAERYIKDNGPNAEVLQQLAQAYYLKGDYKAASEYATKLIKQAEQAKKAPEKVLLDIQLASQHKLDNKAGVIETLEDLLAYYPSAEYWNSALQYLSNSGGFSDKEKIEIYRLKRAVKALKGEEYKDWAELSMAMLNPGDAKTAMEEGTASGAIPAKDERNQRLLNRAKADAATDLAGLDATAKAAESKPNGEPLAKVGAAYLGHGQNDKAVTAIQAAIAKGGLASVDESYVRLGAAYINLGNKAEAIKAFQKVSDKSKLAPLARLWILYARK